MKAEGQGGYAASANRSSGDQLQGLVAPTRAGLIFRAGDTEVTLPLTGLWLRLGGLQQQFLVFDHREYLQWAIRTRDFSILGESAFSENPDLRIQLKQLKRRSHVIRFKRKLKVYAKVTRRRLASVANSVLWFF